MHPLTQLVDRAVSPRRFIVLLLGGFAVFALILASLGIYGLISYSVSRRTQEIGIRMALGASTLDVQGRIVLRTLALAALGLLVGVIISSGLARSVSGLLFGVTSGDPLTFLAAALVLMAIAVLAGYLPARRASRIDPMICLRAD
jgi:ABC-type antimicrobial peptide transport system permease subunit